MSEPNWDKINAQLMEGLARKRTMERAAREDDGRMSWSARAFWAVYAGGIVAGCWWILWGRG